MRFGILGPTEVRRDDGAEAPPGGPRLRALLVLLLLDPGHVVTTERLIDGLYGEDPPKGAVNALQAQVSRLRQIVGDVVERHAAGYRLAARREDVDAYRFDRLAAEGRAALAARDLPRAAARLDEALALWRGPALADVTEAPFAAAQATRLEDLRLAAVEDRAEARLELGRHGEVAAELRATAAAHPLRERLHGLLMRALYADGQQAAALTVFEEVRRRLSEELGADPSPALAAIHLAVLRGDPALTGATESSAGPPAHHGVPAQLTPLIGRTAELAGVSALLDEGRLVTLTGPGGTGKTRLAAEAAARRPGEVCFVEFAPLDSGGDLPRTVLTALGLRETGVIGQGAARAADMMGRIVVALADRPLLLVLDNCEHVIEDAAGLADRLLTACPTLRILATSREALGITGEWLFPVPPLELPPPDASPGQAAEYAAIRLFAERAAAVRPGFTLDAGAADAAARICTALDGLPLAIELAAARLRSMSAPEVAARLGDRFALLSRGSRTAQPRHRTLRSVVEWSWDLLEPEEQALARRLTMFTGGATLDAVDKVCGGHADVLASLVDKSLVELAGDRYRMLETIRAFCSERLAESGEAESMRQAHGAYFLALAQTADPHLRRAEQLDWLRVLGREHDNLHAALHRATEAGDVELGMRLISALTGYWVLRGMRTESGLLAQDLLRVAGPAPLDDLAEEYDLCVLTATMSGNTPELEGLLRETVARVDRLNAPPRQPYLTILRAIAGGPPSREMMAELEARYWWVSDDDTWMWSLYSFGQGFFRYFDGQPEAAAVEFEQALAGARVTGDRWVILQALIGLAELSGALGEPARAEELFAEALELAGMLDAQSDAGELMCRRGDHRVRAGDLAGARADFERAEILGRRSGAPETVALAQIGLSVIDRLNGDLASARGRCESTLAGFSTNWFSGSEVRARAYESLGWISAREGDADAALGWHRQALATEYSRSNRTQAGRVAEGLAAVALLGHDAVRAAHLLGVGATLRGSPSAADPDVARVRARATVQLGETGFATAYRRGAETTRTVLTDPATIDVLAAIDA
ncbi:winged helix-turn-helix domain-containing protein [Streptosporangiaceae bacterium NEAU-GS5]|nr:winged helix-turn-helix domain-containing protein [Streptosporangiaceae bacterium NEAU-GS5]